MTTVFPNLCRECQRLTGDGVCTSFPHGIPNEIYIFGEDHRVPIADELPFELDPAKQDDYQDWLDWTEQGAGV